MMPGLLGPLAPQMAQMGTQQPDMLTSLLSNPMLAAGLGLLASNVRSPQPTNPYAGLLSGLNNAGQYQQQSRQNQLQELMYAAQMAKLNAPKELTAKPNPKDFTPESLAAYSQSGDMSQLVPVAPTPGSEANPLAKVDPKDYTRDSFSKFAASGYKDYSVLEAIPQRGQTSYGTYGTQYNAGTPDAPKWMERVYGSDGSFIDRPLGGVPQRALGNDPMIAGAVATSKAKGAKTGEAAFDLPRVEQNATLAIDTLDKLEKAPGLQYITGPYSLAPILPGTDQAAANALAEQIKGKTFLEAYQTLKGGGQITESEGKKAEGAIARLDRNQSTEDYRAALKDLRGVIKTGLERARKQAGAATAVPPGLQLPEGFKYIGPAD